MFYRMFYFTSDRSFIFGKFLRYVAAAGKEPMRDPSLVLAPQRNQIIWTRIAILLSYGKQTG